MSLQKLILPDHYTSKLDILNTEIAIKLVKDTFERELGEALHLIRVSAPLFVRPESGLNDDLNGVERPVQFDVLEMHSDVQVVHSLAKWKRLALKRYGFGPGSGIYTDMNAIRRDEDLDNLHSVYVYHLSAGHGKSHCRRAKTYPGSGVPAVPHSEPGDSGENHLSYYTAAGRPLSGTDPQREGRHGL